MINLRQFIRPLILTVVLTSLLSPYDLLFAQEDKVDLSLRLLPEYYYKEVVADKNTIMFMEVRNNGNTTITDIGLSADKPEEWVVDIIPDSISYLSAGSSQTVDISIVPGSNIPSGEYTITLLAEATETRMAISTTLRVRNDSSFWVWIGIGVAALVAAGFLIIFLRFGRQ